MSLLRNRPVYLNAHRDVGFSAHPERAVRFLADTTVAECNLDPLSWGFVSIFGTLELRAWERYPEIQENRENRKAIEALGLAIEALDDPESKSG